MHGRTAHLVIVAVLAMLLSGSPAIAGVVPADPLAVSQAAAAARSDDPAVRITGAPRAARTNDGGETLFSRKQGSEFGLSYMELLTPAYYTPPFFNGRGIAAGDTDRDGWTDIVVATVSGPELYRNVEGGRFEKIPLTLPQLDLELFVVALVDFDNDGWLDLFVSSYMTGNFIVRNDNGSFDSWNVRKLSRAPKVLTTSISFGDLDEDGDLDAYAGNWYYGTEKRVPPAYSTNELWLQRPDGTFDATRMTDEIRGETLAALITDFDDDGHRDVIVGNDFTPPDVYYRGDGKGGLRMIVRGDGVIPESTHTTMSIDTADFDNDLRTDIYVTQIAASATGPSTRVRKRPLSQYCDDIAEVDVRARCQALIDYQQFFEFGAAHRPAHVKRCEAIPEEQTRRECVAMMTLRTAVRGRRPQLCDRIPDDLEAVRTRCQIFFVPPLPGTDEAYAAAIPAHRNQNVLLRQKDDGTYENLASQMGVELTNWSWNGLFMDLDNDEWQDLYVVNGTWVQTGNSPQKFFFRNLEGKRFEEVTDAYGLQNFMLQTAYVSFDMDNDGDLDLLTNCIHGPFWLYTNQDTERHSIQFELEDAVGNRAGVGARVRVYYGDGRAQLRELKSGGGYHSFNAPQLHFGLGEHTKVDRIEVDWSTGGTTKIEGPFPADALYTIHRDSAAETAQ